jgi:hypothetical protein
VLSDRCFFFRNNFWRLIAFFKAFFWCELLFTSDTFDQNIITLSLPIVLSNQEGGPSAFSFLRWKYVPPVFCFFRLSTTDVFIRCWRSILSTRNFRRLITQHCRGAFTPGKFGWPFSRPWCVLEHTNRKLNLNHKFLTLIFCDAVWMSQMNTCVFTKLNVLFQFSSVWVIAITSWRRGMMGITCCLKWLEVIWPNLKKTNQFQV